MIENFEKETAPLTEDEMLIANRIACRIRLNVGEEKAVTSLSIIGAMKNQGYSLDGARLRKIINYIRRNRLVVNLVATSKGYYVENNPAKLETYINSLMQRANAIKEVAESYAIHG